MTMPDESDSDYIVIECQKAPNGLQNNYVCVPRSWVKCELEDKKVAFVYPHEEESDTAIKVRNKEAPDDDWAYYIGRIRCETVVYDDAVKCIQTLLLYEEFIRDSNQKPKRKKSKKMLVAERKEPLKVCIRNLQKPSLNKKTKKSKSKTHASIKPHVQDNIRQCTVGDYVEPLEEDNVSSEESAGSLSPQPQVTTDPGTPINTVAPSITETPRTPHTLESKVHEIIQSFMPQTNLKNTPNNNISPKSTSPSTSDTLEMDIDNEMITTNLPFPCLTPEERQFIVNLEAEQKNTLFNIRILAMFAKSVYIKVNENNKMLSHIVSKYGSPATTTEQQQNSVSNNTEEIPQDLEMANEAEVPVDKEKQVENAEAPLPTLTVAEPENPKVKNAKREKINWTLKHPDPGKGLVELGKHTGVYVSADGLKNCTEHCNDVETLAKSLLPEVFTQVASDNDTQVQGRIMRPPMYFPAKIALVNYAMEYGQEVGWKAMEFESILNSLRDILRDDFDF